MYPILIPPIPELSYFASRQKYDLLLSHLFTDPRYLQFYLEKKKRAPETFLILDNSAHEFSSGQSIELLLSQAKGVGADEIVLPDTLFDSQKTVDRILEAIRVLSYRELPDSLKRVMIVPQGRSLEEFLWCFETLFRAFQESPLSKKVQLTIGVSKDYHSPFEIEGRLFQFEGGLFPIFDKIILTTDRDVDIHALGWPLPMTSLSELAIQYGNRIRSTDSARMFTYAMNHQTLTSSNLPKYPKRPENFFDRSLTFEERQIAAANAHFYFGLAEAHHLTVTIGRNHDSRSLVSSMSSKRETSR